MFNKIDIKYNFEKMSSCTVVPELTCFSQRLVVRSPVIIMKFDIDTTEDACTQLHTPTSLEEEVNFLDHGREARKTSYS